MHGISILTSRLYEFSGIALLLGFIVPRNFNAPYLAINLADFGAVVYKFINVYSLDA